MINTNNGFNSLFTGDSSTIEGLFYNLCLYFPIVVAVLVGINFYESHVHPNRSVVRNPIVYLIVGMAGLWLFIGVLVVAGVKVPL